MRFSHHRFFLLDTDSQTFIKPWFPSAGHDIAPHAVVCQLTSHVFVSSVRLFTTPILHIGPHVIARGMASYTKTQLEDDADGIVSKGF